VCLSATISNLRQFGRWLSSIRTHELEVVQHTRRPVPLRHQLFHAAASFFNLAQRQRALQLARRQSARHRGRQRRPSASDRRRRGARAESAAPHPAQQVLDHLQRERLLPVLFFCFSRKECEIKAERNLHRRLLDRTERQRMTELFERICAQFELDPQRDPVLAGIQRRALHGIGYHHAGVLPIHKEVVERLFTSGMLKMLFTTETFALGINMPARTVVFDSLRKFDGVSFDYMKARDYMQMAGRAGRQGIDRDGLVISILDDEALQDAPLADLFGGKVEPVQSRFNLSYSTILNLYQRMGAELVAAYDRSFAAFQAQSGSAKRRERARSEARAAMRARLAVLQEAAYIDADGLLARGRIAQQINGYEIQVTELLFGGVLDDLNIHQLAATFAALVHEERRSERASPGRHLLGGAAAAIERAIRRFTSLERMHGFASTIKEPDFGVVPAVDLWSRGASIHDLQDLAGNDGGDFVRTLRMAVQMMRQLRATLGAGYSVGDRLAEAIVAVNRDVVDAKRQFELG
jgi:superfamily II RNA helicase